MILLQMLDSKSASEIPKQLDRPSLSSIVAFMLRDHPTFSPAIKQLLTRMLDPEVDRRLDIDGVLDSQWMTDMAKQFNIVIDDFRLKVAVQAKSKMMLKSKVDKESRTGAAKDDRNVTFDRGRLSDNLDNSETLIGFERKATEVLIDSKFTDNEADISTPDLNESSQLGHRMHSFKQQSSLINPSMPFNKQRTVSDSHCPGIGADIQIDVIKLIDKEEIKPTELPIDILNLKKPIETSPMTQFIKQKTLPTVLRKHNKSSDGFMGELGKIFGCAKPS